MTAAATSPRRIIFAAALLSGLLLALAVHMLGQRFGLDLSGLWRGDTGELVSPSAALAWWLIAITAFVSGYVAANLMDRAAAGAIPLRLRQFLIALGVLVLASAGQAASSLRGVPTLSSLLAGLAALGLGATMAFCGAHFALREDNA